MGNKTVRPQHFSCDKTTSVQETKYPCDSSASLSEYHRQNYSEPMKGAKRRKRTERKPLDYTNRRFQPNRASLPVTQSGMCHADGDHLECGYPTALIKPGNVLPLTAQGDRSNSRPRHKHNSDADITFKAHSRKEPSYPLSRRSCQSELGTHYGKAQLFRLTDTDRSIGRKTQSRMEPLRENPELYKKFSLQELSVDSNIGGNSNKCPVSTLYDMVPSLRRLRDMLEEFDSLFLIIPDNLRTVTESLLDFGALVYPNGQRVTLSLPSPSSALKSNISLLSELLPALDRHLVSAKDLCHALHRLEEKMCTFDRVISQLTSWTDKSAFQKDSRSILGCSGKKVAG